MAPSLRVEVSPINVRDAAEIEQGINAFAHSSNDGLIVTAGGPAARHRDLIVALAARRTFTDRCAHRLGLAGSWALRSPIRHQVPPSASGAAAPIEPVRHRRLRLHKILIPTRVLEITHLNLTS